MKDDIKNIIFYKNKHKINEFIKFLLNICVKSIYF